MSAADHVKSLYASMPNHSMTRKQIAWFKAGSALNAGQPVDPATGGTASLENAALAPGDTRAKPGKDV